MAVNETVLDAGVEQAWATLSDPAAYGDWVVGAKEIRDATPDWPAPGATFHHTQGVGPITRKDTSSVLAAQPPRQLVLEVRVRPFIVARVQLDLEALDPARTRVRMEETITGGLVKPLDNRLLDRLIQLRNVESLRRLEALSRRRAPRAA